MFNLHHLNTARLKLDSYRFPLTHNPCTHPHYSCIIRQSLLSTGHLLQLLSRGTLLLQRRTRALILLSLLVHGLLHITPHDMTLPIPPPQQQGQEIQSRDLTHLIVGRLLDRLLDLTIQNRSLIAGHPQGRLLGKADGLVDNLSEAVHTVQKCTGYFSIFVPYPLTDLP